MYELNPGEIDFGASLRDFRVIRVSFISFRFFVFWFLTPDTCEGVCMPHNPAVTTIATPLVTATTKERTSFNIADTTYFSSGLHVYMYL